MRYLADEPVNRGRQPEIDCLKAFCVFFMIILHTFEECAEEVGAVRSVVTMIESLTGAACFMLCMGIGLRYSRKQTAMDCLHRGFELLTVGQLLNLLRDALPSLIAWWCKGEQVYIADAMLIVQTDIMTFAGFAFMLLALFKRLRLSDVAMVAVGFAMNLFAFALSRFFRTTGNYLADQALGFFVVTDAEAYFPLCCYFVFVAAGYALGGVYTRIQDKDALAACVLRTCLPVAVAYYALRAFVPFPLLPEYGSAEMYITKPVTDALANGLMTVSLLALFHRLLRLGNGKAPRLVNHMSKHINQYYCYSYVMLTPVAVLLMATRGERITGTIPVLLYALFVMVVCFCVTEWLDRKKLPCSVIQLKDPVRRWVFLAIWIATIAIVIYVYPKVEVFSTIWNNYLA